MSHCRGEVNRWGNPGGHKVEGISHFWWFLDFLSFPDLDQHVLPCGFLFLSTNVRSWTYGVLRGSGLLSMTVQWYFEFSSFCWNPAAIVFFWNIRPDCSEGEIEHIHLSDIEPELDSKVYSHFRQKETFCYCKTLVFILIWYPLLSFIQHKKPCFSKWLADPLPFSVWNYPHNNHKFFIYYLRHC